MANELTVVFSHGQESGPWGTKIRAMAEAVRERGFVADSVDYRGMPEPETRIQALVSHCADIDRQILLVGSSMGGYVSAAAAPDVRPLGLFVLAPAFLMSELPDLTPPAVPTEIVHGWRDDVVPANNSIQYAQMTSATLHLVDGDHRLTANIEQICAYLLLFIDGLIAPA
ncbi:MAG: alpha/beta hydrolase [Pseudomonadota bacterium]